MSELKVHKIGDLCFDFKMGKDVSIDFYLKSEVDACLSEKDKDIAYWRKEYDEETKLTDTLKAEIETLKASHYAEMVDAGMRERRLKRAFYKVCAKWAFLAQWERGELVENWEKWENVERKCRAKAEEYK